jgi:hypothetical protein
MGPAAALRDPALVSWVPVVTMALLESANVGQIAAMWSARSAEGQSLAGWLFVTFALVLWYWYYRVVTPGQLKAQWATGLGIFMNLMVVASVVWFRYGA